MLIVIKSSTLSIFSHSSFSSLIFFSLLSLLKKQVLAWIKEKLHHLKEKKRNGKEGKKKYGKKVATRPKYICTYKAVLMKAKLIWHSVAVWSQEKQSSLQKAQLIVYGVSYSIICETNNRDRKAFKGRVCAGKGCVDTANVRSDRRIEQGFLSWDGVCQMRWIVSADCILARKFVKC